MEWFLIVALILIGGLLILVLDQTAPKPKLVAVEPLEQLSSVVLSRISGDEVTVRNLLQSLKTFEFNAGVVFGLLSAIKPKKISKDELVTARVVGRNVDEFVLKSGKNFHRVRIGFLSEILPNCQLSSTQATEISSLANKAEQHGFLVIAMSEQYYQKEPKSEDTFLGCIYLETATQAVKYDVAISAAPPTWLKWWAIETGKKMPNIFSLTGKIGGQQWDDEVDSHQLFADATVETKHRVIKQKEK